MKALIFALALLPSIVLAEGNQHILIGEIKTLNEVEWEVWWTAPVTRFVLTRDIVPVPGSGLFSAERLEQRRQSMISSPPDAETFSTEPFATYYRTSGCYIIGDAKTKLGDVYRADTSWDLQGWVLSEGVINLQLINRNRSSPHGGRMIFIACINMNVDNTVRDLEEALGGGFRVVPVL